MLERKIYCSHAIALYQDKTVGLDLEVLTSEAFIDFCYEHFILSRLEKKLLPYLVSAQSKKYFFDQIQLSRIRALKQISVFAMIAKLFNENKLTWLSFKGPVLSYVLFGDATLRTSKDIDIWVSENELSKAHEILLKHGFSLKLESAKLRKQHGHRIFRKDDIYQHDQTAVELELHWHLIPGSSFSDQLIIANTRQIDFYQEKIPVFLPEMEFIYLCGHAGKSHWMRLCWLFDLYDYYKKMNLSEAEIFSIAKKYRLDLYLEHAVDVLTYFFAEFQFESKKNHRLIRRISQRKIQWIESGDSFNRKKNYVEIFREIIEVSLLAKSAKPFIVRVCEIVDRRIRRLRKLWYDDI